MGLRSLISQIQNQLSSPSTPPQSKEEAIRVATAGLLLEVAHADNEFNPAEEARMVSHLTTTFALSAETARELIAAADEERNQTIDHFAFTHLLRKNTTFEERMEIVRTMWRIVLADGSLTQHEEYLVRKLAELLGVEHRYMIEAKIAVRTDLGLKPL